jgi:nucleoside-triphosphatase THEP1
MIYILTGDIRTRKTTALLDWCENRNDADGVLCPDNDIGKRYFLKLKSKEEFELEVASKNDIESDKIIEIGPFQFLKSAFEKANDFLIALSTKEESNYLIIDELGKLELKKEGLHTAAEVLIPDYMFNDNKHLILVVRTSLLEAVIKHYEIKAYTLLAKEDLKTFV